MKNWRCNKHELSTTIPEKKRHIYNKLKLQTELNSSKPFILMMIMLESVMNEMDAKRNTGCNNSAQVRSFLHASWIIVTHGRSEMLNISIFFFFLQIRSNQILLQSRVSCLLQSIRLNDSHPFLKILNICSDWNSLRADILKPVFVI